MSGITDRNRLVDSGEFTSEEIVQWESEQRVRLLDGGYTQKEVNAYFGTPESDPTAGLDHVKATAAELQSEGEGEGESDVGFLEIIEKSFGMSVTGLLINESVPEPLPENLNVMERAIGTAATLTGDFPFFVAGGAAGLGIGNLPGAAIGMGAAFGVTEGIRSVLMDEYSEGITFDNWLDVLSGAILAESKGFVLGATTGVVGGAVTAAGGPLVARIGAEAATLASIGAKLEGVAPKPEDFLDAAIVVGGLHGARLTTRKVADVTQSKLRGVYAKTGIKPEAMTEIAKADPTVREDLLSVNQEMPRALRPEVVVKDPDPVSEPFKLSRQQLDEQLALKSESDSAQLVRLFGEDGAKRYKKLLRQENSQDDAVADRAFDQRSAMEETLTAAERDQLFGRGETDLQVEEIREIKSARDFVSVSETEAELVASLKNTLTDLPTPEAVANREPLRPREVVALAKMDEASIVIQEKGFDSARVTAETLKAVAGRFPDPADARFMLERFLSRDAEPPPQAAIDSGAPPPAEPPAPPAGAAPPPSGPSDSAPRRILDRISVGDKAPRKLPTVHDLYTATVDKLHPINRAVTAMAEGATVATINNAYRLARLLAGVSAKATSVLDFGPVDFATHQRVGPGLRQVLEPLRDVRGEPARQSGLTRLDEFREYVVAKRSINLEGRGIETGIDSAEAQRVVRDFGNRVVGKDANGNPVTHEMIRKQVVEYQDQVLKYLTDSGVLSAESAALMKEANQDFVPFYRVVEEGVGGLGKGVKTRNPIFHIAGSELRIVDPLESMIKNTYLYHALADRNAIGLAFVDQAAASPRGSEFAVKKERTTRPVKLELTDREASRLIDKWNEDRGNTLTQAEKDALAEVLTDRIEVFRKNALQPKEGELVVFREGEMEVWQIDPKVADSMFSLTETQMGQMMKIAAFPAKALRIGAIWSPEFIARNPVRDQFTAWIVSDSGFKPYMNFAGGIFELAKKGEAFKEWSVSGGPMAALTSLDRTYLQTNVRQLMNQGGLKDAAWNVVKSPLDALALMSEMAEVGTRLGEFKKGTAKARAEGRVLTKAEILDTGFASREITLDFQRIGARMQTLNAITAFMNANIQGTDKMVRTFKEHPGRTMTKIIGGITIPSMTLYMLNKDEPWWDEIPAWQKDLFWLIPVPASALQPGVDVLNAIPGMNVVPGGDDETVIMRIPKPFEYGVIFGTGAERIMASILEDDPRAFDDFLSTVMAGAVPSLMPQVALPVFEQAANRNWFLDRPLVTARMEGRLPEYQTTPYTTEVTKAIGQVVSSVPLVGDTGFASPVVIDNYIRAWSGGLGQHLLNTLDFSLRKAAVLPDPVKPSQTIADIPIIKAFTVRHPSGGAESISQFEDRYAERQKLITTVKGLAREGNIDAALALSQTNPTGLANADQVKRALGQHRKQIIQIQNLKGISREEMFQTIDGLHRSMIAIAKRGNEQLDLWDEIAKEFEE